MPYTHRKPIHLTTLNSLQDTITYISNPEKTVDVDKVSKDLHTPSLQNLIQYAVNRYKTVGSYIRGHNCIPSTAETEIEKNLKKYGQWKSGGRIAYHTVISFSQESGITNDQLMTFGEEFCKRYYTNYQCVIAGHIHETIDGKGKQPHLHIISSSIDLNGVKLRDDIYNSPTSLAKMREVSDQIALEMGFEIIKTENSQYMKGQKLDYLKSLIPSQTRTIEGLIDRWRPLSNDLDSLLENIQLETGAEVKRTNKNIAIKLPGQKRFKRLSSLQSGYTEEALRKYFRDRLKKPLDRSVMQEIEDLDFLEEGVVEKAGLLVESIVQPQERIDYTKTYTKFEYARMKTKQELENLKRLKNYLDENGIFSKQDFARHIAETNTKLVQLQKEHQAKTAELKDSLNQLNLCRAYLQTLPLYREGKKNSPEYQMHLKLQETLGKDEKEVRDQLKRLREETVKVQKDLLILNDLQTQAKVNDELLKMCQQFTGETYIPALSFSEKNIVDEKDGKTTVKLPYFKGYTVEINTDQITLNQYNRFFYFTAPDEMVSIKDEKGKVELITAEALYKKIDDKKTEIQDQKREDQECSYSVDGGYLYLHLAEGMVEIDKGDVILRIPNKPYYLIYPSTAENEDGEIVKVYDEETRTLRLELKGRYYPTLMNSAGHLWKRSEDKICKEIIEDFKKKEIEEQKKEEEEEKEME